ncbi:MAG: hypothetical protein WD007_03525 [Nitriliruptoraceae bacterium]
MKNGVVSRIVLPIVLPIAVLGSIAAFVGAVAISLLYNTHTGSLALAAVAAGGILFTVSLATSQERLGGRKRTVVLFAAALPLLVGAGIGLGFIGDVDDADRMINVQPRLVVPDDAPVIAAVNSVEFCIDDNGGCTAIDEWNVVPAADTDDLIFVFDNRQVGVPHNVVITDLADGVDDPAPGGTTFASSTLIEGPEVNAYISSELTWSELPDEWYFFCAVHPNMNGVGRVITD